MPSRARRVAHLLDVVDHQAEVAAVVGRLLPALADGEELVAHVDERHAGHAAAELEAEQAPVEVECGVEVADLERDVVDADEAGHVSPLRQRSRHFPVGGALTAIPMWLAGISTCSASSSRQERQRTIPSVRE